MPWWAIILSVYGALVLALSFWTRGKPFWFNYRGKRIPIRIPILRLTLVMWLAAFILFSLPIHIVCRFIGFRGFWDRESGDYGTQNPFRRI